MRKFILLFSCAILLGCDKFVVFDYYLRGEFDAVYCYIPEKGIPCKKDTAISFSAEELVLLHLKKDSEGQNYGRIDYGIENIDGLFRRWDCDTVSFFIFDSTNSFILSTFLSNSLLVLKYSNTFEIL